MLRVVAASCLAVCLFPRAAGAEWQFTPFVGLTFKGNTSIVDETVDGNRASSKVHRNFGGSVSFLGGGIFGVETIFNWTPGFFQQGDLDLIEESRAITWMGNVVVTTPRRWTEYGLRPFVSGGFGLLKPTVRRTPASTGPPLPDVDLNLAGFNVGGGAVGFLSARTGLRFDFRYYSTIRPTNEEGGISIENRVRLRYMTASVGVVFRR
jgi:outer membrane protein with beta-barrel domain